LWRFETDASPNISGVAVAGGVVYFQSMKDGNLYALDAATGTELARVNVSLSDGTNPLYGQTSGPAVSRGQVYVGAGDIGTSIFNPFLLPPPGAIIALGVPDRPGAHGETSRGFLPGRSGLPDQAVNPVEPALNNGPGQDLSASRQRPLRMEGTVPFLNATDHAGSGVATYLGSWTMTESIALTPASNPPILQGHGTSVKVAANGDERYAPDDVIRDTETGVFFGTATRIGGTARFADASGTAGLWGQLFADGSFVFTLEGVIKFQGRGP
jgi:hypothetical protein